MSYYLTIHCGDCLRELNVFTFVVVSELTWVNWVWARERIVDFRVFSLARVKPILPFNAALKTLRFLFLIQCKCFLELSLMNIQLFTI
jgi:hypothetical protein